jgi:hypothetical protein
MKKFTPFFLLIFLAVSIGSKAQYSWKNVGAGTDLPVRALAADTTNHILYAGGIFTQAGGLPAVDVAKWNGTVWLPLGSGILSGTGISALIMNGTELIAGGSFTNIGGVLTKNIARWNGISWSALGSGLDNAGSSSVDALVVYNNELYAGGVFNNAGGTPVNFIARWDGTNWIPLGTGTNGPVNALCVYNSELYVGGTFTDAGGVAVNNIAKWNGTSWSDVGGGVNYTGATTVSTMKNYGSFLFAGGTFSNAGGTPVNNLAKWDGATWTDVGDGTRYTGATTVSTMLNFNGSLIVGGTFDSLGTISANFIGSWDGTSWSNLGNGTNNSVLALESLGDTLYAGGVFTVSDGVLTPFISQWSPEESAAVITSSEEMRFPPFKVFPNPVSDMVFIRANTEVVSKNIAHTFELYDMLGTKVLEVKNIKEEIYFDRSVIANGLYIYKIIDNKNVMVKQGKLAFK